MIFGFDIFGGSQRRAALKIFSSTLTTLQVNPAYLDDGMRFAIYKWASENAPYAIDRRMIEAAELISFCVLGPDETESVWGEAVKAERAARFDIAVASDDDDNFDVKVIKLVLAKDIAAPSIRALVSLEEPAAP